MSDAQQSSKKPLEHLDHLTDCSKCGTSNPPGTRYCENCGASLAVSAAAPGKEAPKKEGGLLARILGRN